MPRSYEVFASSCVTCHREIESKTLPIPLRCHSCQEKYLKTQEKYLKSLKTQEEKEQKPQEKTTPETCKFCSKQRDFVSDGIARFLCGAVLNQKTQVWERCK